MSFLTHYLKDYSDFNYNEILVTNRNDIQQEIKRKLYQILLKFHPDK